MSSKRLPSSCAKRWRSGAAGPWPASLPRRPAGRGPRGLPAGTTGAHGRARDRAEPCSAAATAGNPAPRPIARDRERNRGRKWTGTAPSLPRAGNGARRTAGAPATRPRSPALSRGERACGARRRRGAHGHRHSHERRAPISKDTDLQVFSTGATGLEPATSGVTGRHGATGYHRLRPEITGWSRHFLAERAGCDRLRPATTRQSLCSTRVVGLVHFSGNSLKQWPPPHHRLLLTIAARRVSTAYPPTSSEGPGRRSLAISGSRAHGAECRDAHP